MIYLEDQKFADTVLGLALTWRLFLIRTVFGCVKSDKSDDVTIGYKSRLVSFKIYFILVVFEIIN